MSHAWGISVEHGACRGRIANIRFEDTNRYPNQDGIDVRKGAHDIVIENISGVVGDDAVALTGIRRPTRLPPETPMSGKLCLFDAERAHAGPAGAGKFFLAAMKASPNALWGIYLVDVFDNVTLLCETEGWNLNEPIALKARKRPPAIPDRRRENVPYCTMYCGDIYQGEGLRGVPRGTVKEVRLFAYHYAFHHTGSHQGVGVRLVLEP